ISLPYIGQVNATGKTEAELEQAITRAYKEANLIQNAQVTVTVAEARARTFSVLGAIGAPGQYQIIQSDFRMLDVLVLAKDVGPDIDFAYVIRTVGESNDTATTQPAPMTTEPATTSPAPDMLNPNTGGDI